MVDGKTETSIGGSSYKKSDDKSISSTMSEIEKTNERQARGQCSSHRRWTKPVSAHHTTPMNSCSRTIGSSAFRPLRNDIADEDEDDELILLTLTPPRSVPMNLKRKVTDILLDDDDCVFRAKRFKLPTILPLRRRPSFLVDNSSRSCSSSDGSPLHSQRHLILSNELDVVIPVYRLEPTNSAIETPLSCCWRNDAVNSSPPLLQHNQAYSSDDFDFRRRSKALPGHILLPML
jgi:hypothetical protein